MYIKAGLAVALAVGVVFLYFQAKHWYNSAVDNAREEGRQEVMLEQQRIITRTIIEEQRINEEEKEVLRQEIRSQKQEVKALRQKLEVDHELDALLQAKPRLVLKAVQNGTNQVLAEFEEITE